MRRNPKYLVTGNPSVSTGMQPQGQALATWQPRQTRYRSSSTPWCVTDDADDATGCTQTLVEATMSRVETETKLGCSSGRGACLASCNPRVHCQHCIAWAWQALLSTQHWGGRGSGLRNARSSSTHIKCEANLGYIRPCLKTIVQNFSSLAEHEAKTSCSSALRTMTARPLK